MDLKALIKFVLETCADPVDLHLFASANTTGSRLRAIGVQHSLPSISMIPIWSSTAAQVITEGLLRQKGKLTRAMKVSHGEGVLRLKWSNMSVKGIPSWRPSLARELWLILQQDCVYDQHIWSEDGCIHDPAFLHEFSCPQCLCSRNVSKCSLLVKSGWGHIFCKSCKITSRSKTWMCICGGAWHTCPVHANVVRTTK